MYFYPACENATNKCNQQLRGQITIVTNSDNLVYQRAVIVTTITSNHLESTKN